MSRSLPVIVDFIPRTLKAFRFLGWNPLNPNPSFLAMAYFALASCYAAMCFAQEAIYFALNFGTENSILSLTNVLPCMGFGGLAIVKILTIYGNRKVVRRVVKRLESLSLETVEHGTIDEITETSRNMMKALTVLYITLIWIFNLMPLFIIIANFYSDGSYYKQMPYLMWYPWDCLQPIVYEVCYVILMWGAFTCSIGILSADLMFCAIVSLICVKFNILSSKIRKIDDENSPNGYLREWINEHNEIIQTVEDVENIFSPSVLINFVGSSFTLCTVGFQAYVSIKSSSS